MSCIWDETCSDVHERHGPTTSVQHHIFNQIQSDVNAHENEQQLQKEQMKRY